jgi:two-component system response regulator DesR
MNVLLADDSVEVRWALRTFLHEQLGLTVVGEVAHGDSLLMEVAALRPDIVVLEWELPGRPPREMLGILHRQRASCQIVVVSQRPECREAALQAGADAFMPKTAGPAELLRVLRALGLDRNGGR